MITNPILKYYGAKWRLAKWIISFFPKHEHYVEPFGGGGSVLLQKPVSKLETYNDLDGDVVNFFRTLRERPDALIRSIRLTPWSRQEFEACLQNYNTQLDANRADRLSGYDEEIENARRLYIRLWMSRHAGTLSNASAWRRNLDRRSPANDIRPEVLYAAADRLAKVQIERRDAVELITAMDRPGTLFYLDPPYVTATRTNKKRYAHELDDKQHGLIATAARAAKGFVVLSGYACELYRDLYERLSWKRIDTETCANGGVKRIESVWLSPRTVKAIG